MRWAAGAKVRRPQRYGVFFVLRAWDALLAEHTEDSISTEQLAAQASALAVEFGTSGACVDEAVVARVVAGHSAEASTVAAFAGGVLAVEVMKVLQGKGAPSYVFLALDGLAGHAQSVDPRMPFGAKYTPPGQATPTAGDNDNDDVVLVDGAQQATPASAAGEEDDCVLLD